MDRNTQNNHGKWKLKVLSVSFDERNVCLEQNKFEKFDLFTVRLSVTLFTLIVS